MFGKLKDKLRKSLSIFSKKAEEEAEVVEEPEEVVEEEQPAEEPVQEESPTEEETPKEETKEEPEVEEKVEEAPVEEKKEEKEQPIEKEELKEEIVEKTSEDLIQETKEKYSYEELPKAEREKVEKERKVPSTADILAELDEEDKEEPEKKGFFGKLKQSFTTKTISEKKYEDLFWELELVLLENNVSVKVIEKIKEDLKKELVDKPLPRDVPKKIEETLKKTLDEILTFDKIDLLKKAQEKKPLVITFFGINGAGKTTSIAKLAHYFQKNNLSVVLAACDTFRAAAIDQLQEHADKLKVKMIKHDYGSDAAAVAYDAVKHAEKNNIDVVLIDTAGRLHSNTNLMQELEKIIRVTNPDLKIFVGESITGNDCIEQAQKFNELVQMDGAILTKADVDEKGGAPLSIAYTINKPILFLGMGQTYDDLEEFDKDKVLGRLF
jgi:fused signal recognition particle receptor